LWFPGSCFARFKKYGRDHQRTGDGEKMKDEIGNWKREIWRTEDRGRGKMKDKTGNVKLEI
jgi:hypothetical protein